MEQTDVSGLPEMQTVIQVVDLASRAGRILLQSGAEIMRVENTVNHMMRSYGIDDYDMYTLTNGVFLTAYGYRSAIVREGMNIPAGIKHGYLRIYNVPRSSTDLSKVDAVNTLSRRIENDGVTIEQVQQRLDEIEKMKPPRIILRLLSAGIASGTICAMFGGNWSDSLIAGVIGFSYYILAILMERTKLSKLLTNAICGIVIAVLTVLSVKIGLALDMNIIIVGAIMPLIPGVAFVNGVRDIAYGDYLSGAIKLIDAAVIAFGIAAGVGAALAVFRYIGTV